jgi:hypothetical protein
MTDTLTAKQQLLKAQKELQQAIDAYDEADAANNWDWVDECLGYAINAIELGGWDVDALRNIG